MNEYRVLHMPPAVAGMLVVLQLSPLTPGKSGIRKEPLCSPLFCVIQHSSIEPLRHIDRRLGYPAVKHGKGLVAKLSSPGPGAMAGGLPLAKNSGHSVKRLGCGGCRSVLSNCGTRAMEILEKARPATNANKAGTWRHHCGRVESNVTDSRSAKPKRSRLEHSSNGRDDQGANYAGGPLSGVGSRSTTARAAPPGTPWR